MASQDLKYKGERAETRIGDRNRIREFVTIHRGTAGGGLVTSIGNDNLLMAYTHVAHDVHIGDRTVLANAVTLGGHVTVGDWAIIGASTGVHQFCRIGRHAIIGGYSVVTQDVLPFSNTVSQREIKVYGANSMGLERRGFETGRRGAADRVPAAHALRAQHHAGHRAHPRGSPPCAEVDELHRIHLRLRARRHEVMRYGLIAGNGRFPLLALESARRLGHDVTVIAIEEEASKEVESLAPRCHWISLGQLSKLIEILKQEGITEVVMAGQVKHARIFSSIRPDWRLAKLLLSLPSKNTDGLIGGVIKILEDEGIHLRDSTALLKPLLASAGAMTRRKPDKDEMADIEYGRRVANALAGLDIGQSVAVCERACVAVEAMEGTDAMLRRAAALVNGRRLTLVKAARRREHLLFDVPVVGSDTIPVMRETGTTALAVEAGRTLMLDRDQMIEAANEADIAIVGNVEPMPTDTSTGRNRRRAVRKKPLPRDPRIPAGATLRRGGYRCLPRRRGGGPLRRRAAGRRPRTRRQVDAAIVAVPTTAHEEVGCCWLRPASTFWWKSPSRPIWPPPPA